MSEIKKHAEPIPRPDLIKWDEREHGLVGNSFGPVDFLRRKKPWVRDETVRPEPQQPRAHRLRGDPPPTGPIDPWREKR